MPSLAVQLAAFALGSAFFVGAIRSLWRVLARRSWIEVGARVTSCDQFYVHADEEYLSTVGPFNAPPLYTAQVEYLANGVLHVAELTLTHPSSETTVLYVNPARPSDYTCEKAEYWMGFWLLLLALGCLAIGSGLGTRAL